MNRKSHTSKLALGATLLLLLGLVGLVELNVRADPTPFEGSRLEATPQEAGIGDLVGFALYLINAEPVTLTGILAWNPLPPGMTYASASGGAFPVMGDLAGAPQRPAPPPEGFAYDVRLRAAVPLTEAQRVTGVAWVGQLAPGEMMVPGLIVTADRPAGRTVTDTVSVYHDRELALRLSTPVRIRPWRQYLPLSLLDYSPPAPTPTVTPPTATPTPTPTPVPSTCVTVTLTPAEAGSVASFGETYTETLAAAGGLSIVSNDGELMVHTQHDTWIFSETISLTPPVWVTWTEEFWTFARQYYRFETPAGATPVDLQLPISLHVQEPPSGTVRLLAHVGTWHGPITYGTPLWDRWHTVELGSLALTLPVTAALPYTLVVPLDAASPTTTTLEIVLRLSCEDEVCSPSEDWFVRAFLGGEARLRLRVPEGR